MGPKTIRGSIRKDLTGDGRKNSSTAIKENFPNSMFGKHKKRKKRR